VTGDGRPGGEDAVAGTAGDGAVPSGLAAAVAAMDRLRAGSWESAQTHESLRPYLIEEAYEVLDAIESGDRAELRAELGDLLLQVLFHARIAADHPDDPFDVDDVAETLVGKLDRRAPTIRDADGALIDAEARDRAWQQAKAAERAGRSCVDGIAAAMPALALTQKVLARIADAGLPDDLVPEEMRVVHIAPGGDDAEDRLRRTTTAFIARVRAAETRIHAAEPEAGDGRITAAQWRRYWDS